MGGHSAPSDDLEEELGYLQPLAEKFVSHDFVSVWDIDGSLVTEWLAQECPEYATCTDEDRSEEMLDVFWTLVENGVRAMCQSWRDRANV